jgi:RHS repeat-associated protein
MLNIPKKMKLRKEYKYDANGNQIEVNSRLGKLTLKKEQMTFDSINRMTKHSTRRGKGKWKEESNIYRGIEWHRSSNTVKGIKTSFLYDGDNIVGDYIDGNLAKSYVTPFLDQNLSISVIPAEAGIQAQTYYYSQDGLGSVRILTDTTGAIQNKYDYTSFGQAFALNTAVNIDQRYAYTGREKTSNPEMMYYRWRMYGSNTGIFLHRDPSGYQNNKLGVLYRYVVNHPLNFTDPMGLEWETSDCNTISISNSLSFYGIVGGTSGASGSVKFCDCCNSSTGEIKNRYYIEASISMFASVGLGIGAEFQAFNRRWGYTITGPSINGSTSSSFERECDGTLVGGASFSASASWGGGGSFGLVGIVSGSFSYNASANFKGSLVGKSTGIYAKYQLYGSRGGNWQASIFWASYSGNFLTERNKKWWEKEYPIITF